MEPWNLKTIDDRKADSVETFVIFCEGDVSEPLYFKYFETPLIKVNTIGNFKSKSIHVKKVVEYCLKEKLMVYQGSEPVLGANNIHVWCVYDRDLDRSRSDKEFSVNMDFDLSIRTAKNENLNVAWSNDSFELWILLHFEDIDHIMPENQNREHYYARLTEIMKAIPEPCEDLQKILKVANFEYKRHMKGKVNFRDIVRKEMLPRTRIAMERAEKLYRYFTTPAVTFHEMAPCTVIHILVKELLLKGEKMLPVNL